MEIISQIIGWVGTFLIMLAYFLVSNKKIDANSKRYQLMNLLGAISVGVNVFYQEAWPALTLQIVWGIIAIASLLKIVKEKKIIFICKGNMFRSPIAKALYNKYKKDNSYAESYGFTVDEENNSGRRLDSFPSFAGILSSLKSKEGIDNSGEICKQLDPKILDSADKVIFLEHSQVPEEYKNKNYIYWNIKDLDDQMPITEKMIEDKIDEIKSMVLTLV